MTSSACHRTAVERIVLLKCLCRMFQDRNNAKTFILRSFGAEIQWCIEWTTVNKSHIFNCVVFEVGVASVLRKYLPLCVEDLKFCSIFRMELNFKLW